MPQKGGTAVHVLSTLVFAACSNMDSFVVGLSCGLRRVRVGWAANLLVGAITFFGTALAMLLGGRLLAFLPAFVSGMLGGCIILGIGLWGLAGQCGPRPGGRAVPQVGSAIPMAPRQAAALGFALTLNNVGLGVGASITGLQWVPVSLLSLVCSVVFLYAGNRLGRSRLAGAAGPAAELAASLLMVGLGLYELAL